MAFKIVVERSSDGDLFFFISPEFIELRKFPTALMRVVKIKLVELNIQVVQKCF
jgi:hypothetical protein